MNVDVNDGRVRARGRLDGADRSKRRTRAVGRWRQSSSSHSWWSATGLIARAYPDHRSRSVTPTRSTSATTQIGLPFSVDLPDWVRTSERRPRLREAGVGDVEPVSQATADRVHRPRRSTARAASVAARPVRAGAPLTQYLDLPATGSRSRVRSRSLRAPPPGRRSAGDVCCRSCRCATCPDARRLPLPTRRCEDFYDAACGPASPVVDTAPIDRTASSSSSGRGQAPTLLPRLRGCPDFDAMLAEPDVLRIGPVRFV